MLSTVWAVIRDGKIEVLEPVSLPEGTGVLVTLLPEDDTNNFWLHASQRALDAIWDNPEDNVYAQLLKE